MYIKPTFRNFFRHLKTNKGFSITEVMVTSGLVAIIGVGATNLISNMQKEQRRAALLQVLTSKKLQFENIIKNQNSWSKTVASATNTNMACLRSQVTCDGTNGSAPTNMVDATGSGTFVNSSARDIILLDGSGGTFFDGRQATSTSGFRENGESCTGFSYNMATGNDACPIGYIVNWRASSNAVNPQLYVAAKLIYNPSNENPFKTFINANATTGFGKYDVNSIRTATTTSKTFVVTVPGPSSTTSGCATNGFGTCAAAGTNYTGYTEDSDVYDMITATGGTSTNFTIKETGTYKCTVTTYAFATNGVTAELRNHTTSALYGSTSSMASNSSWGYTTLVMQASFNIATAPQNVFLRQLCETMPSAPNDSCALGFRSPVAGLYSGTAGTKASISCVQVIEN